MSSSQQQQSPNFYRSSFSPTDQHNPHYQSPAHQNRSLYHPVSNGHQPVTTAPPSAPPTQTYPPARPNYYDPVSHSPDLSTGWPYQSRERTSSIHSQPLQSRDGRFGYGAETTSSGSARSPVELHHPQAGYPPAPSPNPSLDRRSSRGYSGDPRPTESVPSVQQAEHQAYPQTKSMSPGEPQSRRGGAMSISSLLSNAEEPPTNTTNSSQYRVSPTSKRHSLTEQKYSRSPNNTRTAHQPTMTRPAPATYGQQWDADATDSELEKPMPIRKFRDFKYHDSMNLDSPEDLDRPDSDPDSDEFQVERIDYMKRIRKRQMELEATEADNRKVMTQRRRLAYTQTLHSQLWSYGAKGRGRAQKAFHEEAMEKVMLKEEEEEKERKKEQQRRRRREKAEVEKKIKAELAAKAAENAAQMQARAREELPKIRIAPEKPMAFEDGLLEINMENIDSDVSGVPQEEEPRKIRKKPGPKKKVPVLATDVGEEKMPEAIKQPEVKEEYVPHSSRSYNLLYEQIWKDIARKEIPKLFRNTYRLSLDNKQQNLRKTAILASKEAQRWKLKTTKNVKDTQARAKRSMREMLTFWKRNEKEERDLRRRAEKAAVDKAKKEEEMREAKRQARKLNFLISQTELYSHFIGRKIKTDDIEKSTGTDAVAASTEIESGPHPDVPDLDVDDGKDEEVTNFENLDFDDEEALKKAAEANAKQAIKATRDKAKAFNQPSPSESDEGTTKNIDISKVNLDEGDMNFQNPTSLPGDLEIQQPKLLNCQLKEYQLKGLNWLCNLYEQGINGILADEMGLGKTVQSISVMAYLAEYHNIWGPFLVIAPASTLHNWQQEITRFVPEFKALPYWGSAKDRKTLRKFWDRKSLTYIKDSPFHVLITSYQLVVQDTQYFQRMKWQYMILDEAQAIKSSSSSRWKALLGFHCRNRLLLTGTPIQNSMQELWALLHFIMPSLFDSHDEFSEWFSKDIESHAQSNTQLNEAQLRRLHMILKPFMLRRVKKHVQKELGDKIETDVFCSLTYRQRVMYKSLRDKINIMDLIENAASGGDETTATLMNLVMQFRKVCNHPDLFERADVRSPLALTSWGETGSFLREGSLVDVSYTTRNLVTYRVPALVYRNGGRLDLPGEDSEAGTRNHLLSSVFNIWAPNNVRTSLDKQHSAFSWLPFSGYSIGEVSSTFHRKDLPQMLRLAQRKDNPYLPVIYDDRQSLSPLCRKFVLPDPGVRRAVASATEQGIMSDLLNVSQALIADRGLHKMDPLAFRAVSVPPVTLICHNQSAAYEQERLLFNPQIKQTLLGPAINVDKYVLENKVEPQRYPPPKALPEPSLQRMGFSHIQVPSMGRFVSDSGKLATLDRLLTELKAGGHRVLLYFQMTRMMDLCEEYLTYRHHKYLRLDGSSKLEDRRDMVAAWQTNPEIFIFILSTRAGGLGINLTAADTVIFYDSDWNPTIDSQAMDRAHRLGQTKQVRVYRLITRGTIEERIRMRAQQKEEVQRVVIQGGDPGAKKNIDFKGSREVATWLFDEEEAETLERTLEQKEKEAEESRAKGKGRGKKRKLGDTTSKAFNIEDMYHEGEGRFDDSGKPSEAGTPVPPVPGPKKRGKGKGNKKKTRQEALNMIDGNRDVDMGGM